MVVIHHLGFLKIHIFKADRVKGPFCVTVPNFVTISRAVAEITIYQFFAEWEPSAILDPSDAH